MTDFSKAQELEHRTSQFGLDVIRFCKLIPENTISRPIVNQLVRSATSIGANYAEANNASSKKDFTNKISICRKEAQETKHWLTLCSEITNSRDRGTLLQECHELTLIFGRIFSTIKNSK